jgi:hypothetical protein
MSTRRHWLATLAAAASSVGAGTAWAQRSPREVVKPQPRMGINLAGLNYWNTELPFVDLMRMSGEWSFWRRDSPGVQVKDATPAIDERGWLRALPEGLVAMLPLAARSHLPDSKRAPWVVRYDGRGEIEFDGALRVVQRAPGRMQCEFVAQQPLPDPSLWLRITRIDAEDPLRNIRVFRPGTENQPATNVWDAGFVARWSGWGALRTMDLQATNNSTLARWSDRPRPDDRTFAPQGIALELLVDLANRCGAGPWLCMPHRADDDFIRRAASMVAERLDERLPVWVEHSNEVWNPDFAQSAHAAQQGVAQGLATDDNLGRWRWHARRSREIFAIWSQPFAGQATGQSASRRRLQRVLGTQTANSWGTKQLLLDPVIETTDVLGVTAYLGLTPSASSTPSSLEVARWPLERVFDHFEQELDTLAELQKEQRRWCARNGLLLAAYEGGQHAVGVGEAAVRDTMLEKLFTQANRDERMGLLYRRLFDRWEDADGDLFCHFSAVSAPSRWGNWGLLEHHDDDPATRPKYRVTLERMRRWRSA